MVETHGRGIERDARCPPSRTNRRMPSSAASRGGDTQNASSLARSGPSRTLGQLAREAPEASQHVTCMSAAFLFSGDSLKVKMASGVRCNTTRQCFLPKYSLASGDKRTFPS